MIVYRWFFVLALSPLTIFLDLQRDMHMVRTVTINTPTTFLLTTFLLANWDSNIIFKGHWHEIWSEQMSCSPYRKRNNQEIWLNINHLTIQPVTDGDSYKYLGIDENTTYNGPLNKENVSKEYLNRVQKIWPSELSNFNKLIAQTFELFLQKFPSWLFELVLNKLMPNFKIFHCCWHASKVWVIWHERKL